MAERLVGQLGFADSLVSGIGTSVLDTIAATMDWQPIGALVGGFLFGLFVEGDYGFWGSMVVAFLGACILIAIVRALAPGRRV